MTKEKFLDDLQKIYDFLNEQKNLTNNLLKYLENQEFDKLEIIEQFAKSLELNQSSDLRFALVTRLVNLRDDSLVQVLKKLEKSEDEIVALQEKAFLFVKEYWHKKHKELIDFIQENSLLTPFYQEIFLGVYRVGLKMSSWQSLWTAHIINGINKELEKKFDGNEEKIMKFLEDENLLDKGHKGIIADRCYSALVKKDGKYESLAYIKAFKKDVTEVVDALEDFESRLIELEDDVFNQKWDYVLYIQSLIKAFSEDKTSNLVSKWADVDRAWMKIKTPIQIGHPLEYYEDHFRKAVALEWDIRLTNPKFVQNDHRVNKIKFAFEKIFNSIEKSDKYQKIYDFSYKSLDKVQLYVGRPALFFGAEFNGLFSAQVVPNDEVVSLEMGKKIFAFSDEILQISRAKPFLKLSKEIFPKDFLRKDREFLFNETLLWHKLYDITTIGHEYGHILWCDDESETLMNRSGNYKNIEEFKATTGGLISYFLDETKDEDNLKEQFLIDLVKRSVGLIAWMEVDEVMPYYCEGLIHLKALFDSKILSWSSEDKKLDINLSEANYEALKSWYIKNYTLLAKHYLNKEDATKFLNLFATKSCKYFMPNDENINSFVKFYFKRYQEIGQEIDTEDKKENYIKKG